MSKSNESPSSPQKRTVEGGVIVEDLKVGNGPVAKPGRMVNTYGILIDNKIGQI